MTNKNNPKYQSLVAKLREIFQIDRPELDFGIYRILNARAGEVNDYLDNRLAAKVQAALNSGSDTQRAQLTRELKEKEAQYQADGINPDTVPKVLELRQKLAQLGAGANEHENAVFSYLLAFFSRYYEQGDFISQRRYKGDTYAIPYAGEEVMLHWANKDQYYTKSGENFSNYSFKLPEENGEPGRTVHFRLTAADTAKDNRKDNDKERRFALIEKKIVTRVDEEGNDVDEEILPVEEVDGVSGRELIIRFEYAVQPKGTKQEALISKATSTVLADTVVKTHWLALGSRAPTEKNPQRTLLEKHLTHYTTKNAADYFIHKDLGGFLRRELDFYIKNEVMNLDDVQTAGTFADIEKSLRMIQCLRAIALDLIAFLAQLENFQKKLWLKKKFVVSSHYCITLDRVPEALYPEIVANEQQWDQWFEFGVWNSKSAGTLEDLQASKYLMVDTALFSSQFKAKLLQQVPDLDETTDGLLVQGDNFHALNLMANRYNNTVKCIYIDPPYNTGGDGFLYKDKYQRSSWLSMIISRLSLSFDLLTSKGVIFSSIDEKERASLCSALELVFGAENRVEEIIWVQNTTKNKSPTYSTNHEYVEVYAKDIKSAKDDFLMFREPKPGLMEIRDLIEKINPNYPSIEEIETQLRKLYKAHKDMLSCSTDDPSSVIDEWKGIYNYCCAEYRDSSGRYVEPSDAKACGAKIWVWREVDTSMPQVKEDSQKPEFKNQADPAYRFYNPEHPKTKKPCPAPKTGWRWPYFPLGKQNSSFSELAKDHRIAWGADEKKIPQRKSFLHEVETNVAKSVVMDFTDGEKELANLFGRSRVFGGPKPTSLVQRFISQASVSDEIVCDFFAGSGTTAESTIRLNYADGAKRKYFLIEAGEHIESIIKTRIGKLVFSEQWQDGKPKTTKTGMSHCLKTIKLESYEDTLNNLQLRKPAGTDDLFNTLSQEVKDDYLLNYMLDVESRDSLMSVEDFKNPFDYMLNVAVDSAGAFEPRKIDLVETFNYLIGLRVKHIDAQQERGFVTVTGTLPSGETCLVLWRDCDVLDYDGINQLCDKLAINPADNEFDLVYINGDHNIPTKLTQTGEDGGATQSFKLRQIEPEFLARMFSVEDL